MTDIFIIITILFIMSVIIFLLIKKTVKDINHNSKEYYLLKLQDYDNLISDNKEKQIDTKVEEKVVNRDLTSVKESSEKVLLESNPEYQIDDFLKLAKDVDKEFNIDVNEIIRDFMNRKIINTSIDYYNNLLLVKKHINSIGLYNLTVDLDGLKNLLIEVNQIDSQIVNKYKSSSYEKNIMGFYNFLKNEINYNDPTIYIEVGDKNISFNNVSENIKTIYNPNIYKGIIIKYKNSMYDYSLSF